MTSSARVAACAVVFVFACLTSSAQTQDWPQWGRTAQHSGSSPAVGQSPTQKVTSVNFDPFAAQEMAAEGGELLIHYQAPLVDKSHVFLETKTGTYTGPNNWNTQIWNERAYVWQGTSLVQQWNFQSDWKPVPDGNHLGGWEPVFHAALGKGVVFVPGFGGSVYRINESDGTTIAHYRPFGPTDDPNTYVTGPITVSAGNIYYNVMKLDSSDAWGNDVLGAWLVKVSPSGQVHTVSYDEIVPGAPHTCDGAPCGHQRPSLNVAPVVSNDGLTVYTVSRAHFTSAFGYIVAVGTGRLTAQWNTSLRGLVGRNAIAYASDLSSSSPIVTPDASILYGALSQNGRGYLVKLDASGNYQTSYTFGWDVTPAIYSHDGTYSVITKDNHYGGGPYYITQLDADLKPEWKYKSPTNFEWCVNAPAVDSAGTVYANSEDGNVYVINQGGTLKGNIFLRLSVGAAYTPVAIGRDGRIYTENDGDMFVVGN